MQTAVEILSRTLKQRSKLSLGLNWVSFHQEEELFKKYKDILNSSASHGVKIFGMLMGMVDSYLVAHLGLIAISGMAGSYITIYQAILLPWGNISIISSLGAEGLSLSYTLPWKRLDYSATGSFRGLSIFASPEMIGLLGTEASVAESGGLPSFSWRTIVLLGLMTSLGALIRATPIIPRLPFMWVFYQCLEYSLFKSSYFVLDMGIAGCCRGPSYLV